MAGRREGGFDDNGLDPASLMVHLRTGRGVRFGHESSEMIRHPHEIAAESANQCASQCLT
jgi:hypothetical protein